MRKKKKPEDRINNRIVSVALTPELNRIVRSEAKRAGMTVSEWLRAVLHGVLSGQEDA